MAPFSAPVMVLLALTILSPRLVAFSLRGAPHSSILQLPFRSKMLHMGKKNDVRPSLDDVERISKGQAAKKRGTGSRGVPHRLNEAERKEWDLAKKRRFLLLRGSGWRKERGDSPLANIYRQFCDSQDVLCVTVSRGIGNPPVDEVIVDFSPLRRKDIKDIAAVCISEASELPSHTATVDNSDVDLLGWDNAEQLFDEEVIWRIPVFSVVSTFSDRSDSRHYAEVIAQKFANGVAVKEAREVAAFLAEDERIENAKEI